MSVYGYTKKARRTARMAHPRSASPSTNLSEKLRKGSVTILYVGQDIYKIPRLFRDRGVTTHIRPYNTISMIRATLVRPKEEQCGVVYQITCANCPAYYVGEIKRPLSKRLKEYQRPGSPVRDHLVENNVMDDVVMKHREKDWFRRGAAKSIHIAEERPTLNRDRGRHLAPSTDSCCRHVTLVTRKITG